VSVILRLGNVSMREDRYDEEEKQEAAPFQRKPPVANVSQASIALTFRSPCKLELGPCSRKYRCCRASVSHETTLCERRK
jgi:hypothetical protein